jgi:hypothetical protein
MTVNMKRNRIRSGKPVKRTDIFNIKPGNLFSMGMSSSASADFLSPISNNRRGDTNAYYEEMKPLFLILRAFGLLPYHVTSEGKSRLVRVT